MAAEWNQPKAPKWAHNLPGPGIRELNFINRNPGIFGRNVIPEIKRITFLDHLPEKKGISFDISKERKLTVMACLSKNREDLYIGADGGINAADICGHLFEGLKHLEQIVFTWDSFHTDFTESFFPYVQGLYEPENAQRHILQDLESGFFQRYVQRMQKP